MAIGWKILLVSNESSMIISREFLECPITSDEIKRAVWDCGGDRAPGPDGFTFKFFTSFWDVIHKDVIRFVQEFFHTGEFPIGCNLSFIALIPKVANARFVSNFWRISLIGSQYKIVGKILANKLSMVISSCMSSEQSAFVKGRNILDGPIIINEVIAWYRKHKKNLMVFKVDFEKAFDSLRWDYLDLIMSKFSFGSLWRSWILGCLRNARSSILINGSPTQEFDIKRGLRQGDPLSPFLFILAMEGLYVLSRKAKSLGLFKGGSIGYEGMQISHLMFADDVIFLGEWSRVSAINLLSMLSPSDLWVKVIKFFHGDRGRITDGSSSIQNSTWGNILSAVGKLKSKGIDLFALCSRKLGDGKECKFWEDSWCGSGTLKSLFSRVYNLEVDKNCFVGDRFSIQGWSPVHKRSPRGGAEASQIVDLQVLMIEIIGFSVASARNHIDALTLDVSSTVTRWNKAIPIKINVFLWRLSLNKLATRINLDRRGIDLDLTLCPLCMEDVETANNLFFSCDIASAIWNKFASWWQLDIPVCANIRDWYGWLDSLQYSNKSKAFIAGTGSTLLWCIWKFQNELLFSINSPRKSTLWDSILSLSFCWISSRNPNCSEYKKEDIPIDKNEIRITSHGLVRSYISRAATLLLQDIHIQIVDAAMASWIDTFTGKLLGSLFLRKYLSMWKVWGIHL
uniref:RNA-directed DNA polymerase, eukaryota, reverse transcriptase zinc-binding domain protein n=1 Tax=Tanacetum cinerariifolium TaxID=118510 RepID=A0A6L2K6L5_TANCI|nr:RNA-directed DNA polymerase, eukaryota, reverse transcriptase zinc-binding domain protein [Tanacetum cinerariifolium]